jgi:uncharacterized protein (TIGR02246 family)
MLAGWLSILAGFRRFRRAATLGLSEVQQTISDFSREVLTMNMKAKYPRYAAALVALTLAGSARAEDLRAVMEADNTRWEAAFNTNAPAALATLYTKGAVLLPPGTQPVNGRQAIGQFWEGLLKPGDRKDIKFEIVSLQQDGQYAYHVDRYTLSVLNKTGEAMKVPGEALRIFERQPDGTWLTKVHIFNRHP